MIFLAINGDDVGSKIGSAIASDDRDNLLNTRAQVKEAQDMLNEWAAQFQAEELSSSGDEVLWSIDESAIEDLDNVQQQYQQISGHTVTIGYGSTMSEAIKALIYGKVNGKNQIVEYTPEIDAKLESPEEAREEIEEEGFEPENEEQVLDNPEDQMVDEREFIGESLDGEVEGELPEEAMEEAPAEMEESQLPLDQKFIEQGNIPGSSDEDVVFDGSEEDLNPEMKEEQNLEGPDGEASDDMLVDMIHSHMEDEEVESPAEHENDEELKANIFNALQAFKTQKEALEASAQQNPEFYEATLAMLKAMIEMAKRQGIDAEGEMEVQDAQASAEEEMPPVEDLQEEEMVEKSEHTLKKAKEAVKKKS